jgi:hypothetical protein
MPAGKNFREGVFRSLELILDEAARMPRPTLRLATRLTEFFHRHDDIAIFERNVS